MKEGIEERVIIDPYKIIGAYRAWDLYDKLKKKVSLGSSYLGILDTMFSPENKALEDVLETDYKYRPISSHGNHIAGIIAGNKPYLLKGIFPDGKVDARSINSSFLVPLYSYSFAGSKLKRKTRISNLMVNKKLRRLLSDHNNLAINCSFGYGKNTQKNLLDSKVFSEKLVDMERKSKERILLNALDKGKDFLIVQAAGNYAGRYGFPEDLGAEYSVHFLSDKAQLKKRIITVGALENSDKVYQYSQLGDLVDIMAPGYRIFSAKAVSKEESKGFNGFTRMTGTSQAAGFVTGACSMLWYLFPDLTGPEVKGLILDSAHTIYSSRDGKIYKSLYLYDMLVKGYNFKVKPSRKVL